MDAKKQLEANNWEVDQAVAAIQANPSIRRDKPVGYRALIEYNHNRQILGFVVLSCQTDFVGRTPDFLALGKELAMQIVGGSPKTVDELLNQEYLKDTSITVRQLVDRASTKVQESIVVQEIHRFDVGVNLPITDEMKQRIEDGKH